MSEPNNNEEWYFEELVLDFTSDGTPVPIEIVAEITGLTYEEIRSSSKIEKIEL